MTRLLTQCILILVFVLAARQALSQITEAYGRYVTPVDIVAETLQPRKVAPATALVLEATPLAAFPNTTTHPVFFEARQYPATQEPPVKTAALPETARAVDLPPVRLRGIILIGGIARALIEIGSNAPVWLTVGDAVGDWQLKTIDSDRIEFANGVETATVELYKPVSSDTQ